GIELVLEAYEQYWRKSPSVKRLVFKSIPDESTRLAMLKRGEADIAYSIRGPLAEELRRTPGLTLKPNYPPGTFWLVFPEQWTDPKSPWADRRVRLAANHAIDRPAINKAETLGFSKITGSIIPATFEFFWSPPVHAYDLARTKRLLEEAGGDPPSHPAAHPRQGDVRAHLGAGLPQRPRAARGGVRPHAHRGAPVLRAVRGLEAQGQIAGSRQSGTEPPPRAGCGLCTG